MRPFKNFLVEEEIIIIETYDADDVLLERLEKPISTLTPEQHKAFRQTEAEADHWIANHPIHHQHIVDHYNAATAEEKYHGHTWYSDAHHMAKVVSHDTKTPVHTTAGLISNYSPQTHWHTNILTASKVARTKRAMGGPGSGVFATKDQKHAAHRMLKGEHYDNVLVGHKTRAFAHLIEHGGNQDNNNPRVVVDRHAYSVASGSRISDAAYGKVTSKLKTKKGYGHAVDAYHKAAKQLSEQHGETIHPHQVQATTWLVRQRLNGEEDRAVARGVKTHAGTKKQEWTSYAKKFHPKLVGKEPGTGNA